MGVPYPFIWNTSGGGGVSDSFTTIQTDSGTYPVAGGSDTLSLLGDGTYINTVGDATADSVTISLDDVALTSVLDSQYVLKAGDTMTGELITPKLQVTNSTNGNIPFIINASVTPSVDQFQIKTNGGAVTLGVSSDFRTFWGTSAAISGVQHSFVNRVTTNVAHIVRAVVSQSADIFQTQDSAGTVLRGLASDGRFFHGATAAASTRNFLVQNQSGQTGNQTFTVKSITSQTGNLLTAENTSGTIIAGITNTGVLYASQGSAGTASIGWIASGTLDTNTGFFQPSLDAVGVTTAGTQRVQFTASGSVVIGGNYTITNDTLLVTARSTTIPNLGLRQITSQTADYITFQNSGGTKIAEVTVGGFMHMPVGAATTPTYSFYNDTNTGMYQGGADIIKWATNGTDKMTLNSAGTLTVGTTDTMTVNGSVVTASLAVNSSTQSIQEWHTASATAGTGSVIYGARSRGSIATPTVVSSGDNILDIYAVAHDGTDFSTGGRINFSVGTTPGANDMPTNFALSLSADGTQSLDEVFAINYQGNLRAKKSHNNAQAYGGSSESEIRSASSIVPTGTAVANISGIEVSRLMFERVGNIVTCSGLISSLSTSAAATLSQFRITLPISSNLVNNSELNGTFTYLDGTNKVNECGTIEGDVVNNEALFSFYSASSGSDTYTNIRYVYQYEVL